MSRGFLAGFSFQDSKDSVRSLFICIVSGVFAFIHSKKRVDLLFFVEKKGFSAA